MEALREVLGLLDLILPSQYGSGLLRHSLMAQCHACPSENQARALPNGSPPVDYSFCWRQPADNAAPSLGGMRVGSAKRSAASNMVLTHDFKETVKERVARDPAFREALLKEALELMLSGDVDLGNLVLRDYINATIGFEMLALETGTPSKSLMRMFSPKGNPRANNLFAVISQLQKRSGLHRAVTPR
jgi:DNA-binding phage protein